MSKFEQCSRCRLDYMDCGCYDYTTDDHCSYFVQPIDNSKMFSHWYNFTGRIGRIEYLLTFVISVILYFFVLLLVGKLLQFMGVEITTDIGLYVFSFGCMLPSVYLLIAAGVKRAHDAGVSWWYALTPLIPLFFIGIITIAFFIIGFIYLFTTAGDEGVNEYGSNPTKSYQEQLIID